MDLDASLNVKAKYPRGINLIEFDDGTAAKQQYSFNYHGDVISTVNSSTGDRIGYDYDAYGNQLSAPADDANPFRYSGEYYDHETGFIYLRARYYDTTNGRFLTEDPARDGINWYAYCAGNPLLYKDPSGEAIVIQGNEKDRNELLSEMQKLTNDELALKDIIENGITIAYYVVKTGNRANQGKHLTAGTQLVHDLLDVNHYIYISYNDSLGPGEGGAGRVYKSGGTTYGNGTSSKIEMGRGEGKHLVMLADGTTGERTTPFHIALGHEMIHSWRMAKGMHLEPDNKGNYKYLDKNGEIININNESAEELATTGISYWTTSDYTGQKLYYPNKPNYITENALRHEQGLPFRVKYS